MVGMYYDDFGNASLSYGYDSSQIAGTNYSMKDLYMWAKYIYFNWGGRIIYALMLIPLLKNEILTMGMYWASASVLYVWPVLFFILLILHYGNLKKKINDSEKINANLKVHMYVMNGMNVL